MDNPIAIGTPVRVRGRHGEFVVKGYNKDGSYLLYGGKPNHGAFVDARAELVRAIPTKRRKKEES